jgi:hypothetical protein
MGRQSQGPISGKFRGVERADVASAPTPEVVPLFGTRDTPSRIGVHPARLLATIVKSGHLLAVFTLSIVRRAILVICQNN